MTDIICFLGQKGLAGLLAFIVIFSGGFVLLYREMTPRGLKSAMLAFILIFLVILACGILIACIEGLAWVILREVCP